MNEMLFVKCTFMIVLVFNYASAFEDKEESFKFKNLFRKSKPAVKFYLYDRQRLSSPENMEMDDANGSLYTSFDSSKPLKMIIHGWMGSDNVRFSKRFKEGLLQKQDVNLICVDWSRHGSKQLYPMAKEKVPQVAQLVANFLDYLSHHRGVHLEQLHILGHSLGAHVAGLAGRMVTSGKVGRITGFDPAGPFFSDDEPEERLSSNSANFVDVIHTCNKYLGLQAAIGHVDFYPNGGLRGQPGCGKDLKGTCSHRRAYLLYLDSIPNKKNFPAVSCPSWKDFLNKEHCDLKNVVYMGENVSTSARGKFYLETKSEPPYGLGQI